MKYPDGADMRVGDRVRIRGGPTGTVDTGTIVISFDTGEYSPGYAKEDWAHNETGILVVSDRGSLVRFDEPFPQRLVVRITEQS